jgi:hypothetical protein
MGRPYGPTAFRRKHNDRPHRGMRGVVARTGEEGAASPLVRTGDRLSVASTCRTDTFGLTTGAPNEASSLSRPHVSQLTPPSSPQSRRRSYVYSPPVKHQVRESVNLPVRQSASIVQYGRKLDNMDGSNRGDNRRVVAAQQGRSRSGCRLTGLAACYSLIEELVDQLLFADWGLRGNTGVYSVQVESPWGLCSCDRFRMRTPWRRCGAPLGGVSEVRARR